MNVNLRDRAGKWHLIDSTQVVSVLWRQAVTGRTPIRLLFSDGTFLELDVTWEQLLLGIDHQQHQVNLFQLST